MATRKRKTTKTAKPARANGISAAVEKFMRTTSGRMLKTSEIIAGLQGAYTSKQVGIVLGRLSRTDASPLIKVDRGLYRWAEMLDGESINEQEAPVQFSATLETNGRFLEYVMSKEDEDTGTAYVMYDRDENRMFVMYELEV